MSAATFDGNEAVGDGGAVHTVSSDASLALVYERRSCADVTVVVDWSSTRARCVPSFGGASGSGSLTCDQATPSCAELGGGTTPVDCSGCTCNKNGEVFRWFELSNLDTGADPIVGYPVSNALEPLVFCLPPGTYNASLYDVEGTGWYGGTLAPLVDGAETLGVGAWNASTHGLFVIEAGAAAASSWVDNVAGGGGGAHYYDGAPPRGFDGAAATGNAAAYGPALGTPVFLLEAVNATYVAASGNRMARPVTARLRDELGHVVRRVGKG